MKYTTKVTYIDEATGEILNINQFKNYYYETKRQRTIEATNRGRKINIEISGKQNGQTYITWEEPPGGGTDSKG